ncbi:MAG: SDR family NAD(P)-dependent oxidoreductase [Bacteroidetes bacterium]|nr:SDR family NAD(P)-dependent oxidoreductase [Bacteroidota bacterium]
MISEKQRVLITGASSGIGRALSVEYGRRGADVLLLARNEEQLYITKEMLESKGGSGFVKVCDVTIQENMNSAVEFALKTFGGIDIAILNAGIGGSENIDGMNIDTFKYMYEVNIFGIAYGVTAVLPLMKKQGSGKIVGIGTLADARGLPGSSAYSSSKAAMSNFLESARIELKKFGIKVITVKPGFIKSNLTDKNDFYMPMLMEADKAAKIIVKGIKKNKSTIKFPKTIILGSFIAKVLPVPLFDWLITYFKNKKKP